MQVEVYVEATGTSACPDELLVEAIWQQWFGRWLAVLQPDLSPTENYELSLRLTDDAEIQCLNRTYRQLDKPTDVLAFAALESAMPHLPDLEALYLGDIVISIDTAARQAAEQHHDLRRELTWLAAHGLLHLLGWDHPDDETLAAMLQQQEQLLAMIEPAHKPS